MSLLTYLRRLGSIPKMYMRTLGPELLAYGDGTVVHESLVPACRSCDSRSKYTHAIGASISGRAIGEAYAVKAQTLDGADGANAGQTGLTVATRDEANLLDSAQLGHKVFGLSRRLFPG